MKNEIDWEKQWATFAPGYGGGMVRYGDIKMIPGGGFGDLSHPTTRIMLELMKGKTGNRILDIGCGSGILSLAAAKMGGQIVGIDIDPVAVAHAEKNRVLNGLANVSFSEGCTGTFDLILMNMIMSEQQLAWNPDYAKKGTTIITSGVLAEQRDVYLQSRDWKLVEEREEEGWRGFVFEV